MDRPVLFVAPEGASGVYRKLLEKIDRRVQPIFHDIELARGAEPPGDWSIQLEASSIANAVDSAGLRSIDVVGYSGGAAMSLAFVATHSERVRSLTLAESPWIGNDVWSETERHFVEKFDRAVGLPPPQRVEAILDLLAPGLAPPTEPSKLDRTALMLSVVWAGYRATPLDRSALRRFGGPVLLPVGAQSNSRFRAAAEALGSAFSNVRIEVLEKRNHFDLFWKDPSQIAGSILRTWNEGDARS